MGVQGNKHTSLSTDPEYTFDKIQHPYMIKPQKKLGMEGSYLE